MKDMSYLQSICRAVTCKTAPKKKKKRPFLPTICHEVTEAEYRHSSIHYPLRYMRVGGQQHDPSTLAPGRSPNTHWTGRWVGPRAGLDARAERSLSPTGILALNCTAFGESPYWIHHLNSSHKTVQLVTFIEELMTDSTACLRANEGLGNLRKA